MGVGRWFTLAFALPIAGLFIVPRAVRGDPWEPLDVGRRWEYRSPGGAHQVVMVTGTMSLRGRTVAVKSYFEGLDAGLENYWQNAPDGTVLLCGFYNRSAAFALAYEPPIAYLPGPPALGASRTTNVTAYDLLAGGVFAAFPINLTILEEVDLDLPAGHFHALGTGQVPVATGALTPAIGTLTRNGHTLALDGRTLTSPRASLAAPVPTDWYSDGVGDVQYGYGDLYQLLGTGLPTAVRHVSWSAIKQRAR